MFIPERYIDHAARIANEYFPTKVKAGGAARVAGANPSETAEIWQYLENKDFGDADSRITIKSMMERLLHGLNGANYPQRIVRDVVYLAGAMGSKRLLKEAAAAGKAPEIKEFLDDPAVYDGDFANYKNAFRLDQRIFADKTKEEPYGKWRPLISGVDHAIMLYCREHGISQIIDNTAAPVNPESYNKNIKVYREQANRNNEVQGSQARMNLFAVALTPEQAIEEAVRQAGKNRANTEEAKKNAESFATFFPHLQQEFENITLYNRDMKVVYAQRKGKITAYDPAAMQDWKKKCGISVEHRFSPRNGPPQRE